MAKLTAAELQIIRSMLVKQYGPSSVFLDQLAGARVDRRRMTGVGVFGTVFFFPRKRRMLSQPERRNQAHRASPGTRAKANAVQLSECGLTVGAVYDRTILLLSSTFLDCEERRAVIDRAYSSATLTLTEQYWAKTRDYELGDTFRHTRSRGL